VFLAVMMATELRPAPAEGLPLDGRLHTYSGYGQIACPK
jgi:hypothetical protein